MRNLVASIGATVVHFLFARWALNEEDVAREVRAIGMMIEGRAALVTLRNYVVGNALGEPFIEYKVDP